MTTIPQYRAWRFGHPAVQAEDEIVGFSISPQGGVAMVDGDASIRQAVLILLTTIPGERVMRPDYGCQLHQLYFAPNDDTTAGLAIFYVRRAIERWEPRIEVLQLDANRNEDSPEQLDITLIYRVRATLRRDLLTIRVDLAGERV